MIGSAIKHIPIAGRDITAYVQQLLRDRNEGAIPPEDSMEVARRIKEMYSYVCPDLAKEFRKYDMEAWAHASSPALDTKYFKKFAAIHSVTKKVRDLCVNEDISVSDYLQAYEVDVGYERFLGPEIFFNPEIASSDYLTPLPTVVDQVIQNAPIDTRRPLYKVTFSFMRAT